LSIGEKLHFSEGDAVARRLLLLKVSFLLSSLVVVLITDSFHPVTPLR
jgi:hypothetical protein